MIAECGVLFQGVTMEPSMREFKMAKSITRRQFMKASTAASLALIPFGCANWPAGTGIRDPYHPKSAGYNIYFGDLHNHSEVGYARGSLVRAFEIARNHLDFLGFTHICGKTHRGKFCVLRQTMAKKKRAKLADLTKELRRRMHRPIRETGPWLRSVLLGHYQYYGVPRNGRALSAFRYQVLVLWRRMLRRRSQKNNRITWSHMERLAQKWLPQPRITHPYPHTRLRTS